MKYKLNVEPIPNQVFVVDLGDRDVEITLQSCYGLLLFSALIDGESVASSVKCIPSVSLLPAWVESMLGGRLYFDVVGNSYPSVEMLGTDDCRLIFEEF